MTNEEFYRYLDGTPTIEGIVAEMKTWWSYDEYDMPVQNGLNKILEIAKAQENQNGTD